MLLILGYGLGLLFVAGPVSAFVDSDAVDGFSLSEPCGREAFLRYWFDVIYFLLGSFSLSFVGRNFPHSTSLFTY